MEHDFALKFVNDWSFFRGGGGEGGVGGGGGRGGVLGDGVVCVNTMTFDYQHSIHLGKSPGGEGLSRRRNGGERL